MIKNNTNYEKIKPCNVNQESAMSKLEQLIKQQDELAAAIEAEKAKCREETLDTVRGLCKRYGITMYEVKP